MNEEIFVSGRMNRFIDPNLNIWHWQIPSYLFIGGLAAGILILASIFTILKKDREYPVITKVAPFIVPFLLIFGLLFLFIDLNHKLYFWRLYLTLRLESPMSWGAWTLLLITILSFFWCGSFAKEVFPKFNWTNKFFKFFLNIFFKTDLNNNNQNWNWKYLWLQKFEKFVIKYRLFLAWLTLIFSIILGIYTGILLSAFNARPLWNTSILGPLFLTSGLSTGTAVIILMSRNNIERILLTKIDLAFIFIELFFIAHMFMGFLASTQVQINAAEMFLGGDYTVIFWVFVVFIGLILPAFLEIFEINNKHVPKYLPSILILIGGIILRFVIVYAGQASKYIY